MRQFKAIAAGRIGRQNAFKHAAIHVEEIVQLSRQDILLLPTPRGSVLRIGLDQSPGREEAFASKKETRGAGFASAKQAGVPSFGEPG